MNVGVKRPRFMSTDEEGTDFLLSYVRNCAPVQWVGWWANSTEPRVKQPVYEILFDSAKNQLRDLTAPHIADAVTAFAAESDDLLELIRQEVYPHLEKLTREMIEDEGNDFV